MPVVYAFHGVGDSPDSMAQYSALDRLASTESFVLVYPAAQKSMWATVDLQRENADTNRDVRFLDRLHDTMRRRPDVDTNRVYFVGMSNGGEFAQAFGSLRSHVTAVISHSAARPRPPQVALKPFPLLLIVGKDDPIAERVASDADAYRAAGHEVELVAVPRLGHAWAPEANRAIARFLQEHN
jgi:poly(3-hydroxybutyrate) depolymerase